MVNIYHQQLSYCVVQYVEKEADTATHILKASYGAPTSDSS